MDHFTLDRYNSDRCTAISISEQNWKSDAVTWSGVLFPDQDLLEGMNAVEKRDGLLNDYFTTDFPILTRNTSGVYKEWLQVW